MQDSRTVSIPDYVRCGAGLYYVTWRRLLAVVGLVYLGVIVAIETAEHLPTESDLIAAADAQLPAGSRAARRAVARKLQGGGGATRAAKGMRSSKPTIMRAFCTPHSSINFLGAWNLAALGTPGWPTESDEAQLCDWAQRSKTEMSFSMCTFNRTVDTQISATIHREGMWNAGKAALIEKLLPRVNEMMDMPDRIIVVDVGSNIGFYTLLAATRGYDTVAIEPSREAVSRLLFSLRANGVRGAQSGEDTGINTGHTRRPVSFVYANAASDVNSLASLRYVPENPGASWVEREGTGAWSEVPTVFLDDLLAERYRDATSAAKHPGLSKAPALDPTRIRLVKISAESGDARALHGMRRLLSLGRVPYVMMVYNVQHVTAKGCDPRDLVQALWDVGYRLYHAGVFIYRPAELARFLKGITDRSTELVFVRDGAPFL